MNSVQRRHTDGETLQTRYVIGQFKGIDISTVIKASSSACPSTLLKQVSGRVWLALGTAAVRAVAILLCLCQFGVPQPVVAATPVTYSAVAGAQAPPLDLIEFAEIAEDKTRDLDVRDVVKGSLNDAFQATTRRNTNLGFTDSAYWVRFTVSFGPESNDTIYLVAEHPMIDDIEFYSVRDDGETYIPIVSGDRRAFEGRKYDYRNFVFDLEPQPGTTQTYYVRLASQDSALSLPLYLYSEAKLARHVHGSQFVFGAYYGMLGIVAVGSLVFFFLLRDVVLLAYFAYLSLYALMLIALNGFGYQYLWPASPEFQASVAPLFGWLSSIAGLTFVRLFLDTKRLFPRTDALYKGLVWFAIAAAAYHIFAKAQLAAVWFVYFGVLLPMIVLPTLIRCVALGYRPARYFLAGTTVHLIGIFITSFYYAGLLPNIFLAKHAMQIGSLAEFMLLAAAIGDRIALMKRDKEHEIAAVNLELSDLNQNLEALVCERTAALEEKNAELQELAVRDSLTGLYNHSTTIELMEQTGKQSYRYDFPMAIIMLDLDHFKNINDSFGHLTGDEVLRRVARELEDSVRDSDIVGRYGGEEFVVILPYADAVAAKDYGRRLLANIRALEFADMGSQGVTASGGIAVSHPHNGRFSSTDLIKRADDALYNSKRDGRDRLTLANLHLVSHG